MTSTLYVSSLHSERLTVIKIFYEIVNRKLAVYNSVITCTKNCFPTMPLACLSEKWDHRKKKGDPAAIAEDKKKKKKKKGAKKVKSKTEEGEEGRAGSDGERAAKKKNEKKVKKKKKSKVPVPKTDGGLTSDEDVQPQVPLHGHKTEL